MLSVRTFPQDLGVHHAMHRPVMHLQMNTETFQATLLLASACARLNIASVNSFQFSGGLDIHGHLHSLPQRAAVVAGFPKRHFGTAEAASRAQFAAAANALREILRRRRHDLSDGRRGRPCLAACRYSCSAGWCTACTCMLTPADLE